MRVGGPWESAGMSKETKLTRKTPRPVLPMPLDEAEDVAAETSVETTAGAVESTMDAIVSLDEAIASLEAMRMHVLAALGRLAIGQASAERLDTGVAVRELAGELALRERRSDRAVEAEVRQAIMSRSRPARA